MRSKQSQEGYLLIDHRATHSGSLFESATVTCSHCQRQIVLNPNRSRDRAYCPKCDHYICDSCELTRVQTGGTCKTFKQIVDETYELASRGLIIGG